MAEQPNDPTIQEFNELYVVPQITPPYAYLDMSEHVADGLFDTAITGEWDAPGDETREPPEAVIENAMAHFTDSIRNLIKDLWTEWTKLGINTETKSKNITYLMHVETNLHEGILRETKIAIEKVKQRAHEEKEEALRLLEYEDYEYEREPN